LALGKTFECLPAKPLFQLALTQALGEIKVPRLIGPSVATQFQKDLETTIGHDFRSRE
jgi:hypothetical protein